MWDNLLYYYAFNFNLIQNCYKEGKLKDQPFRRIPGYVKYDEDLNREQDEVTGEWKDPKIQKGASKNKRKAKQIEKSKNILKQ